MSKRDNKNLINNYVEESVLVIERIFPASPSQVFQAFAESKGIESWWGPQGWRTVNKAFIFGPEGRWHYCMKCIDTNQGDFYGKESWGLAIYKEIIESEKIVYDDYFSDSIGEMNKEMPRIEVTLLFEKNENGTKLITSSAFSSKEALEKVLEMGIVEGMTSQFEKLDAYLQQEN